VKEMRRGSVELVQKILEHQPRVVCFVGKKIWDEFEFVIKKTAKPAKSPWTDLGMTTKQGKFSSQTYAHPTKYGRSAHVYDRGHTGT
jgi:hypothetical protein